VGYIVSANDFPTTEDGNNWTTVVFRCPKKKWTETLKSFYSELDKQKLSLIPHYTIRSFDQETDSLMICFNILRKQQHEGEIRTLIEKLMNGYDHEIDPRHGTFFYNFHKWIHHGDRSEKWTTERCQILSKISRFVLEIVKSDTSREDKEEWTHLFSNMAAVFEKLKVYTSPETVLSPDKTPYRILSY